MSSICSVISIVYNYNYIFLLYRLILIAEKETVYEKFPTPLINRLEKHFVLTKTILLDWQKEVLEILETWVNDFCDVSYSMSTRLVYICIMCALHVLALIVISYLCIP